MKGAYYDERYVLSHYIWTTERRIKKREEDHKDDKKWEKKIQLLKNKVERKKKVLLRIEGEDKEIRKIGNLAYEYFTIAPPKGGAFFKFPYGTQGFFCRYALERNLPANRISHSLGKENTRSGDPGKRRKQLILSCRQKPEKKAEWDKFKRFIDQHL